VKRIQLLGEHKVSYDFVRSLAIDCHALDITAYTLFISGIHQDGSNRTKEIYDEKLSTSLLHLAVAVRTLLYQGADSIAECPNIDCCGFYESDNEKDKACISIKDVCDKIIHTDIISREFEESEFPDKTPVTCISGKYQRKKWMLDISLSLFCESILNWIDKLEKV
jgi:hypothetical protein